MTSLPDSPPPYGTIVFDCDSTLSRIEGIEELAKDCRAEVELLTAQAMDGKLPLEEAYGARLELIQPTSDALREVADLYLREALAHSRELIAALHDLGKAVWVVSGGLLPAVQPFAEALGIEAERVRAVGIQFDAQGGYESFETDSPLARSGGKIDVLREIAAGASAGSVAFIGDGATDLEAASEVSRFVAFGGVVRRPLVFDAARVHCESADFAALLPLLTNSPEREQLRDSGSHQALLQSAPQTQP